MLFILLNSQTFLRTKSIKQRIHAFVSSLPSAARIDCLRELEEASMAEHDNGVESDGERKAVAATHNLGSLLATDRRDFLLRNNGDQVSGYSSLLPLLLPFLFYQFWIDFFSGNQFKKNTHKLRTQFRKYSSGSVYSESCCTSKHF